MTETRPPIPHINLPGLVKIVAKYAWFLFIFSCVLVAYLALWDRGMYSDDYLRHSQNVRTLLRASWTFRPLSHVLYTIVNIGGQLFGRIISTGAALYAAWLAGQLIYRLSGSRLASIVTIWFASLPIFAAEAILWESAIAYPVGAVLGFLATQSFIDWYEHDMPLRTMLKSVVLFIAAILMAEQAANFMVLILGIGFWITWKKSHRTVQRYLKRSAIALTTSSVALFTLTRVFYHGEVQVRGGADLVSGLSRWRQWLGAIRWHTISRDWMRPLLETMFELGRSALYENGAASLVFTCAVVFFAATVYSWQSDSQASPAGRARWFEMAVACLCLMAAMAAVVFPGMFVVRQIVEYRMLYFPSLLASMSLGAVVAVIQRVLPFRRVEQVILLCVGLATCFNAVTMFGFANFYKMRSDYDQMQLAAIQESIPEVRVPDSDVVFAIHLGDEAVLGYETPLNSLLLGVLEASWSAQSALQLQYPQAIVQAFTTNRWEPPLYIAQTANAGIVRIQGTAVPVDALIVLTYQDGTAYVYERIVWQDMNGNGRTVDLPFGMTLANNGSPSIPALVYHNE